MTRSRLLVATLIAVVVVLAIAGGGAYLVFRHGGGSPSATAQSTTSPSATLTTQVPTGATSQDLYNLAAAASAATLAGFVPPPGSTKISGKPAGWVGGSAGAAPADPSLTRVAWWRTPMAYDSLKTYLAANPPPGMTTNGSSSGAVRGNETSYAQIYQSLESDDPAAYTAPALVVNVQTLKGRTYLEAVTFIDAHYAVPEGLRIGERVTSVRIEGVSASARFLGASAPAAPAVMLTQPQDAGLISELVQAYDALPGGLQVNLPHPCPPPRSAPAVVTFTGESGRVWVATLGTDCNDEVQVSVDGKPAYLPLSSQGWLSTLQTVVAQASGSASSAQPAGN